MHGMLVTSTHYLSSYLILSYLIRLLLLLPSVLFLSHTKEHLNIKGTRK